MKQTIASLVDGLCRRCQLMPKEATPFVQELFNQIVAGLEEDKIVKVRGLGTFKLLNVEERASMNVHSGERIVIPEHYKMTFTPDAVLRDEVNKPFADFESVEINEDTPIEALMGNGEENGDDNPNDNVNDNDNPNDNVNPDLAPNANANESVGASRFPRDDSNNESNNSNDNTPPSNNEKEMAQTIEPEKIVSENVMAESVVPDSVEAPDVTEAPSEPEPANEPPLAWGALEGDSRVEDTSADHIHSPRSYCGVILGSVLALLAGYILGSFYPLKDVIAMMDKRPLEYIGETRIIPTAADADSTESDTTATAAETQTDATKTGQSESAPKASQQEKPAAKSKAETATERPDDWPQVEGGEFWIVGEIGKDTMKVGKNLLRISKRHYGSDKYVPYICVMNNITNPDIVPLNKELRLPKLRRKE